MLKKISLNDAVIILSAVILLTFVQLSYADGNSTTVDVPNTQGGYTALVIQKSSNGYIGPQGEYYPQFPTVSQLQVVYGLNAPQSTAVTNTNSAPSTSQARIVTVAPPDLPVYVQPDPPDPTYIWAPGYWAYGYYFGDYYWVPGTWVTAPYPGLLWTPGYWYWRSGNFVFRNGYWGAHVGFYGGINYGYGYGGYGFSANWHSRGWHDGEGWHNGGGNNGSGNGGNWHNGGNTNNASFNGGPGGTNVKPTPEEKAAMKEKHFPATAQQKLHVQAARKNPSLRASVNHGRPAIAATTRPGVFKGKGVVAAKQAGAFYNKTKPMVHRRPFHIKRTPPRHLPAKPGVLPKNPNQPWGNGN